MGQDAGTPSLTVAGGEGTDGGIGGSSLLMACFSVKGWVQLSENICCSLRYNQILVNLLKRMQWKRLCVF